MMLKCSQKYIQMLSKIESNVVNVVPKKPQKKTNGFVIASS